MKSSVIDIIQEMYSKSAETISISAIFMLWSVSRSFYALTKGISAIYKNEEEENYIFLRVKGIIGAIAALLLVIVVLILLVFGNSIESAINERFYEFSKTIEFILDGRKIISITRYVCYIFTYVQICWQE